MHVGVVRTYRSKLVAPLDGRASNLLYIQASWHTRRGSLRHRVPVYGTWYVYTAQKTQQENIYSSISSDVGHDLAANSYHIVVYVPCTNAVSIWGVTYREKQCYSSVKVCTSL